MTLGSADRSDRLVLAARAKAFKLATFPKQPQILVTQTPTLCASGSISYLVNRCVGAQTIQQLLHTKRLIMPTLTEQRDVVLVYELKLRHAGAELK